MKFLVFCLAAGMALFGRAECFSEEVKALVMTKLKECSAEVGVSEDVVMKALTGDFSEETKLKGLALCFAKKVQFMDENGNLNIENIKEKLKMVVADDTKIDSIVVTCTKTETTAEDTAFNTFKCFHRSPFYTKENLK